MAQYPYDISCQLDKTQTLLLVIVKVRFANEISIDCLFTLQNPQYKNIMIYNMLEVHIPITYIGPGFIDLNIYYGF